MLGFEIKINDNHTVSIAARSSQLFITKVNNNFFLLMSGTDFSESRLKWPDQILKVGDKVNIKVKDILKIDSPSEVRERDFDKIKHEYLKLKEELENKNLI